ncbi:4'-phosphopantetheinyl transferase family protein [Streptomyces sp. NPDC006879]|uniref:4'-phosphopantetheinyl transferase family protein n=1 Tax=Streptomyces sp. NPDC006879 TaxID=3364767 RepID=UPI0036B35837
MRPPTRPLRNGGPDDSWQPIREEVAAHGTCVVYAAAEDWLPRDLDAALEAEHGASQLADDLGPEALRRVRRMAHPANRSRYVASRLFLKSAASAVLGTLPRELELAHKPGGRPHLRGIDQLDVSLSHTDQLLVVGLTRFGRIGVDTEYVDRRMLGLGTERQACTPYELDALAEVPEEQRNRELVRLWTLKEAYSKAIGQGLRFRFTEFGFGPRDQRLRMLRPDGTPGTGWEWTFHSWLLEDSYTVSAAVYDPGFHQRPREQGGSSPVPPLLPVLADPRSSPS